MTNAILTPIDYEVGFRLGLEWASTAPEHEVRELVERTREPRWPEIVVGNDWLSLPGRLLARGSADGQGAIHLPHDAFVGGFVESASFLWWDPDSVDDDLDD